MATDTSWKPTLTYSESQVFEISFIYHKPWQKEGVALYFRVTPNLDSISRNDGIKKSSWEEQVIKFLREQAAEITGLKSEDFTHSGFFIEPGYFVTTAKKPKKKIEV